MKKKNMTSHFFLLSVLFRSVLCDRTFVRYGTLYVRHVSPYSCALIFKLGHDTKHVQLFYWQKLGLSPNITRCTVEDLSTEHALRTYANRQPDCSSNPQFWGEDWSCASSPFLSQTRALSCYTIARPLFLHSSLSQSGMCQVSQIHTFRGRGDGARSPSLQGGGHLCRMLEDCLFLHLESSGWLDVAAAQHIAYILAWALVGKTYAGFVLACRYTLLCGQQSAVKTAEEGGAVRLVTHLENYCNTDTGEHMYCTERYCSSVSFIFIVSFHLAYPDSWKALCVSRHRVYEQLNFNSAQVEGENILMHDSTNQWQKFASYMKSYIHKP